MPFHVFNGDYSIPREYSPLNSATTASIIEFPCFESEDASGRANEEGHLNETRGLLSAGQPTSDFTLPFCVAIREQIAANDFEPREDLAKRT